MSKPTEAKKPDGKKIIEDAKKQVNNKTKGNTEMKKTILTVVITLITVAAFAGMFLWGASYGASQNQVINDRVHSEVKALSVSQLKQ